MTERRTQSKIPLEPFYRPMQIPALDYQTRLNDPGEYPYARGRRGGTSGRSGWIQQGLSGEGTPTRSNQQFKRLIEQGATGVDVIGDSPTMSYLDPDHPLARYAVGTQGVSLCRLQDYLDLYSDLPLGQLTLSHSLPAAFTVAGLYLTAKRRGTPPDLLRGSVIQVPFYCEDCSYATRMPFDLRLRLTLDSIEFCAREMPRFHSFLEDTYYISDGGLDAVEEMALGLIEIRHIVRHLLQRGLDVDRFAPRIAILVNCRMDIFEEIAKIRATRRLFAKMMREEFGATDPRSWSANITAHTSGLSLTAQQPANNIVRGTVQALALALAGVQGLEISGFDEAYRTPSQEAHLLGLRTQQIIHLESNAGAVADPLGGSYYVEWLTDEMERRINEMVAHIESQGDPKDLCENGFFRRILSNAMARYAREVEDGTIPRVGVNLFQVPDDEDALLKEVAEKKIEPAWERINEIREFRERRDPGSVRDLLARVRETASDPDTNLMGVILASMEGGVTIGEISGALRLAYGWEYDPLKMTEPPL